MLVVVSQANDTLVCEKETDIRRGRHCVFLMHVHLVFVTRYRRQIFDYDATEKLRTYFSNVCADFEAELV